MLKEKDRVIRRAMMGFDGLVIIMTFILAFLLRRYFHFYYKFDLVPFTNVVADMSSASISDYLVVLFFVVPLWCLVLYFNGMYHSLRTRTLLEVVWILIKSAIITTLAFGSVVFLFKLKFVSRAFFFIFISVSFFTLLVEKIAIFAVARYVRKKGYNFRRLLVVGSGPRAANFIAMIKKHPEWGLKITGVLDYEEDRRGNIVEGIEVMGTLDDISNILHNDSIDEVVYLIPRDQLSRIEKSLYVCETEGVKATIAIDLFELRIARSRQTDLEGLPLITFETTSSEEWQMFIKRALDIIISGIGIIVLSPLLFMTAILIKLTSTGPVFYLQKRLGLNGRKFILYKFRSMYKDAHLKQSELLALNEMSGPVFKIKNDPRITPLGRILRKLSVDELPQLFNVFMGDMSLVGPRPPIPKEVAQYEPWQRRRLSMRPGITCLWQISGRNKIGFEDWMKLDLEYIDNWSLWLDFKIFMKTIPVVLFGIGAY